MEIKLLGTGTKDELEKRIQKVAVAGKLSRFSGNVFEALEASNDYENNLKMIKRIIKMGHKSIIEHDYLVFAICDVSPIIEQTIIGNRLTSFTIKSRREVDFRKVGYYIPNFRGKDGKLHKNNDDLQKQYKEHIEWLFNIYAELKDNGAPGEDARFILPYCYHSNIIMGLDARELEKMILYLTKERQSQMQELKEFGEKLYEIVQEKVPYLLETINDVKEDLSNPFEYIENLEPRPELKIIDKTKMISYTKNPDDVVLLSSIMYHYQCSLEQAEEILKKIEAKDKYAKEKMMDIILHKEERRELEQVNFTFQIPISLAILTHLTRHRMHPLLIPEFVPMWNLENYIVPPTIEAKEELKELYMQGINKNIEMFKKFKEQEVMEEDLIYFYLGAQMLNVVTSMNARSLQWICRMRCCNKAQWQIRIIAKDIANMVKDVAPLIGKGLGSTCITDKYCGEGRESCGLINKLS